MKTYYFAKRTAIQALMLNPKTKHFLTMITFKHSYTILILALALIVAMPGCKKDFEEINTDPHGFTTASDGSLFNSVIESMVLGGDEQFYVNNEILYKQTQMAALTKEAWGNFTIGTEAMWSNYYKALPAIRELEKRIAAYGTSPETENMKAMLLIVRAYNTFKLTDIFGDIPYTEAGYGFQDLAKLHPKYDTQRDIYFALLDDLQWADEHINDTAELVEPFTSFKGFDRFLGGDLAKWRKLANSLRLRYAMRMVEKEPVKAGEIISDIITNNRPVLLGMDFTTPKLESACLWPAAMGFNNWSQSWSFREHNGLRMGSNIWHQLSAHDSTDGSGIFDPRAYIFFETDNKSLWHPFPQVPSINTPSEGGIPYGSHRDNVAAFTIKGEQCQYSPFNYFIVADCDFMPIILMTGAEVHFLKAEAYFRGIGVPLDKMQADIEYMNGINASVEWWKTVAGKLKLATSGMTFNDAFPIPGNVSVASVLNHFGSWMATTDEQKLQFIYTQCWLDAFRQPWDAYALARRTNLLPREGAALNHFRMPYPPSEAQYNSANMNEAIARQGGDSPQNKLWWMP